MPQASGLQAAARHDGSTAQHGSAPGYQAARHRAHAGVGYDDVVFTPLYLIPPPVDVPIGSTCAAEHGIHGRDLAEYMRGSARSELAVYPVSRFRSNRIRGRILFIQYFTSKSISLVSRNPGSSVVVRYLTLSDVLKHFEPVTTHVW